MDRIGADFDAACRRSSSASARNAVPIQLPIGAEADFAGIIDLIEMKADRLQGRQGQGRRRSTTSPTTAPKPPTPPASTCSRRSRLRRRPHGADPRRGRDPDGHARPRAPQGDARLTIPPGALRLGPSRTRACSRCSTPSSTTSRARSTCPPSRASTRQEQRGIDPRAHRRRTSRSPPWRSRSSPTSTSAGSPTSASTRASSRRGSRVLNTNTGKTRTHRPHPDDARQRPRGRRRGLRRRHRRRRRRQEGLHGRHAVRPGPPIVLERSTSPSRSSGRRSSPRPRPTRRRWRRARPPGRGGPDVPGAQQRGDRPDR